METTETLSSPIITNALLKALEEAFMGDETNQGWMNGLGFSLEHLSAENASRSPASGRPTPAAHADHIRVTFQAMQAWARGENPTVDWASSWKIANLSEREWDDLRAAIRAEYENTQETIRANPNWTEKSLTSAINNVTHLAYHAGAIRQLIKL
jgi:hypothetical protein